MLLRRLGVAVAGLLLGAAGWAAPATAADGTNDPPPPPDCGNVCEPPPPCDPADPNCAPTPPCGDPLVCPPPPTFPTELGTAAEHADTHAATGIDTAADAITAARTRQGG